jgi:hypothetical protein
MAVPSMKQGLQLRAYTMRPVVSCDALAPGLLPGYLLAVHEVEAPVLMEYEAVLWKDGTREMNAWRDGRSTRLRPNGPTPWRGFWRRSFRRAQKRQPRSASCDASTSCTSS